jgi:hypothetical protein
VYLIDGTLVAAALTNENSVDHALDFSIVTME